MTLTGLVGKVCMWPLRAIINACVRLGIHPNTLTLIGVLINVVAYLLSIDGSTATINIPVSAGTPEQYYRAVWQP